MAGDLELRGQLRRETPSVAFLFDDHENRMVEVVVNIPTVDVDAADLGVDRRLVGDALVLDVAGLIGAKPVGAKSWREWRERQSGVGPRIEQRQLPGQFLPGVVNAEIEPRLYVLRKAVADVAVDLRVVGGRMLSIAVGVGECAVDEEIEIADHARDLRLPAHGAVTAAVDGQDIGRERRMGGRRHEIDGAAERGGAVGERIAALQDLDRTEIFRIDLIHVSAAVGVIHRNAVLEQLQAAQMEIAREVGAAHRQAKLLAVTALHEDARHFLQRVAQIMNIACLNLGRVGVDEGDRADGSVDLSALLGDGRNRERSRGVRNPGACK